MHKTWQTRFMQLLYATLFVLFVGTSPVKAAMFSQDSNDGSTVHSSLFDAKSEPSNNVLCSGGTQGDSSGCAV